MKTSSKHNSARAGSTPQVEPTEAEIQHAAHRLWLEEGQPAGRELDHWLAAKELLRHQHGCTGVAAPHHVAARLHFPSSDQTPRSASPTVHP